MKKYIVANWKMAPSSLSEAQEILERTDEYLGTLDERKEFTLIFCPPFVFTEEVGKLLQTSHLGHQAELGAQDIFWEDAGADTGEISGPMLKKLGVRYVIIGHSERRWKLGESDEVTNKKLKAALRNELIPIVCVGERTKDENFKEFIKEQISTTFTGLSKDDLRKCIIAYEPVWAISTSPNARPDKPEDTLQAVGAIKNTLIENWKLKTENLPKVLYGGSVNSKNAKDFLSLEQIAGVLVGGASVNKEEFVEILRVAY